MSNAFYADQIKSAQEAEEVLDLLQLAGLNRDHLALLMGKLYEQLDKCWGVPDPDLRATPRLSARGQRIQARLAYLRANAWKLPLALHSDTRITKTQFERSKVGAGPIPTDDLRRIAVRSARKLAKQKALRK